MDDRALSIWRCFATLRDPRTSRRPKKHLLLDLVAIALCAVLAGAADWPQELIDQYPDIPIPPSARRGGLAPWREPERSDGDRSGARPPPRGHLAACSLGR